MDKIVQLLNGVSGLYILSVVFFISLVVVSSFLFRLSRRFNRFFSISSIDHFEDAFNDYTHRTSDLEKEFKEYKAKMAHTEELLKSSLQHFGLVRFNPFQDTGGNQSYSLCLMDGLKNGVVLTSLHSRTGTRFYAKTLVNGQSEDHILSKEEDEARQIALKSNE